MAARQLASLILLPSGHRFDCVTVCSRKLIAQVNMCAGDWLVIQANVMLHSNMQRMLTNILATYALAQMLSSLNYLCGQLLLADAAAAPGTAGLP
jgi:hypothetical protein